MCRNSSVLHNNALCNRFRTRIWWRTLRGLLDWRSARPDLTAEAWRAENLARVSGDLAEAPRRGVAFQLLGQRTDPLGVIALGGSGPEGSEAPGPSISIRWKHYSLRENERMNDMAWKSLIFGFLVAVAAGAQPSDPSGVVLYPGTCEPSAAVMLEPGLFLVGDDDQKDLRIYRTDAPGDPEIVKISNLPGLKKKADLEGAARIGDAIYWIGSHSRKNSGVEDLDRHRLFAITVRPGSHELAAVGTPYESLIEDLQKDSRFEPFHLGAAAMLPPTSPGGLNIEGLAATPEGALLIGFRNPIPGHKALIIPLNNPREVLDRKKPTFGDPIQLDLRGLGIRSLEHWPAANGYVILGGSFEDGGTFRAFRWDGPGSAPPPQLIENANLDLLVPEAVFFDLAAPNQLVILSDDGDACPNPPAFRSRRVTLALE